MMSKCVDYEKEIYPDIFTAENGRKKLDSIWGDVARGIYEWSSEPTDDSPGIWDIGIGVMRDDIRARDYLDVIAIACVLGDIKSLDIEQYLGDAGSHYRRADSDNTQEAIKYYYFNSDWTKLQGFFEINVDKYISRFINKHYEDRAGKDKSKKDLLKAIHYSLLYMMLQEQMEK